MQWLAPWSWLGLGLLALPVLVHLLSRQPAPRAAFPSLRFIAERTVVTRQRRRISDWPLLLVRLGILAVAVAALSQPIWNGSAPAPSVPSVARVIDAGTVDQSAATTARAAATRSTDSLRVGTFRDRDIASGIARAVVWLRHQPAPRRLEIVSTMAAGRLDSLMFVALPRDLEVSFRQRDRSSRGVRTDSVRWLTSLSRDEVAVVAATAVAMGGAPVLPVRDAASCIARTANAASVRCVVTQPSPAAMPGNEARTLSIDAVEIQRRLAREWPAAWGAMPRVTMGSDSAVLVQAARDTPEAALALVLAAGGVSPLVSAAPPVEPAQLQRWAALRAGPPIGAGVRTRDVHAQPTWARFGWMLVLLLLAIEWWHRRQVHDVRTTRPDGAGAA